MKSGDPIDTGALAWEIITSNADGITVSGGEPFLQAEALAEMLRIVRGKRDMGVIVYTGYTLEELAAVPHADELLAQTDLLVDGPYVQELDDGKSLRGSSNQRVHLLTPRYAEHLHLYGAEGREAQVFYHGAKTHRVGIPTDNKYTY
jgi:anaerobic ribonucleoside-triphosphate reductase activating protein